MAKSVDFKNVLKNIPSWVPANAASKFCAILTSSDLKEDHKVAFSRMIKDEGMKKVWALLKKHNISEEELLDQILFAFKAYWYFLPDPKINPSIKKFRKWDEDIRQGYSFTSVELGIGALNQVNCFLNEWKNFANANNQSFCENKNNKSFDDFLISLQELGHFFEHIQYIYTEIAVNIKKYYGRNTKNRRQHFFSVCMSDFFRKKIGDPKDNIVSELVSILFDVKGGTSDELTRGRRRKKI